MPVRLLNSSVLKWPDLETVRNALEVWSKEQVRQNSAILAIGYFGSYARGNWGVGSDLDLVMIVDRSDVPTEKRSLNCDTTSLPVPVDLLIYTQDEWARLSSEEGFWRNAEIVWIFKK